MTPRGEETLALLRREGIPFDLVEHPPAYTMEDIIAFGVDRHGPVLKNLFLRDSKKGKRHWLVSVRGEAPVDLALLGAEVGERLSFASEQRLEKYLQLPPGAVSPLGALFDETRTVEVLFDGSLADEGRVGVHPCDNTATVFLAFDDLRTLVERHGNPVRLLDGRALSR